MKILILASNPRKDLNLEGEIRHLQEVIERAKHREQLEVEVGFAVRPEDLQGLLLKHEPEIVHFCGHGTGPQGLVLQDENRIEKLVSTDALSNLFELCSQWVKCVLLNACYSEVQANAIIQHIDYAIGMNHEIRDDAAIAFATGFYQALGYGQPIEQSYKFGRNAIQLQISDNSIFRSKLSEEERKLAVATTVERVVIPEHLKPVLKINPNLASNVDKSTSDASENLLPSTKLDIQSYIDKALEKEIAFRQKRKQFPESPTDNTIRLKKQPTPWCKSLKVITTSVATLMMTVTGMVMTVKSFSTFNRPALTGNFSDTCKISKLSGTRMFANCANTRGNYEPSSIDLNDFVSNLDGNLVFSAGEGTFVSTCDNIQITKDGLLTGDCLTKNQQWNSTELDLNEIIDNNNGVLERK